MTFSQPLCFSVPVLPRIRKFLLVHYPNGLVIDPHDHRTAQFWMLIQTEKVKIRTYGRSNAALTDSIQVQVYQTTYTRQQRLLNELEVRMVNKMLDLFIFQEFFALVKHNRRSGAPNWLIESLHGFTDRYDFSEEDLAESTLKMAYYRHMDSGNMGFDDASLRGSVGELSSYLLPGLLAA